MTSRYWVRRLGLLVLVEVLALGGTTLAGLRPDLVLLAAIVGGIFAACWLLSDALVVGDDVRWEGQEAAPSFLAGRDRRLSAYARVIEDQLTANQPSDNLRLRLRELVQQRLAHDPDATVPPRLSEALYGAGRIPPATLAHLLDDIEGLR